MKAKPFLGMRFGNSVVLADLPPLNGGRRCLLLCTCGTEYEAGTRHLVNEHCWTCRKCAAIARGIKHRTHGMSGTPTFKSWSDAIQRCYNPNDSHYPQWGGRGIRMCDAWHYSFENFFAYMGVKPPGTLLDRIDNDGHYEPGNCRWITDKESRRNKQQSIVFTVRGTTACLIDLCDHFGMTAHYKRVWARIAKHGWSPERALTTPVWVGHGPMPAKKKRQLGVV